MASATRVGRLRSIHTKKANGIFATTYLRKTSRKDTGERNGQGHRGETRGKIRGYEKEKTHVCVSAELDHFFIKTKASFKSMFTRTAASGYAA